MIATVVLIVRDRLSRRAGLAALAFLAVAWLGLLISFSQSSFAALLVAVLALTPIVWRWKSLFAFAAVLVVAAGIAVTQRRRCMRYAITRPRASTRPRAGERASLRSGSGSPRRTRRTALVSAASSTPTRSGHTRRPRRARRTTRR